ncbi:thioredoxin domain-containing protein [Aminobacter anthyllidis]|uniref:thioredoxin domain-containing protein n=1 Tax=Aminobacter anthyllidis TaxID=1035067 RepID=UPI00245780FB|nr:thioredoxin domain-containing protein [Aminobacter anthyllidis]MDH4987121.1 thioredoxin domain-containing protein [Aminobacter anthyllidis]
MLLQENLLRDEGSPYLRQHGDNPVHWRPWSPAALAEAVRLDRPILLSVGYAACHWCHVMAHESFENAEVAEVMNRLFVNIKVDREERPDIDQIYMAALASMGEQGGWPLTMFLTPDARPFWGGTYFPREARYGRPGFIQVLNAVDAAWRGKRASILQSAGELAEHVSKRLGGSSAPGQISIETARTLASGIYDMIDRDLGGLRGAPKFPNAPFMQTLWLSWLRSDNQHHRDAVTDSLQHMLAGGIYDHVGGGLARYSTDAQWLVPHFEKMLYDNAQLIRQANWAYAATGNQLFRVRIEDTITWLLREMLLPGGTFASSLDADSEGEEGLFYTWTASSIQAVLGDDSAIFFKYFTITKPDGWEGDPIIHQTAAQAQESAGDRELVSGLTRRLLAAREKRIRPGRDDKALTDWNGLAIVALAEAGRSLDRNDWVAAAAAAFDAICASASPEGRLPHSSLGEKRLYPALSSDYAAMINAAISLFEATRDASYLDHGAHFLQMLESWHADAGNTGHYLTASDSADVPMRIRGDIDEAIPSATSQIIEAMVRLANTTGDLALQQRAWTIAEHAAGRIQSQQYGQAGIVNACVLALQPSKLIVVEDPAKPSLVSVANRNPDPRRVDIFATLAGDTEHARLPGDALPDTKKAGAYLCTGLICLPVVSDPAKLEEALRRR